jgi:hypothetical protein
MVAMAVRRHAQAGSGDDTMSCYFRQLGDLFDEAGIQVTQANRKALRACIAATVGLPDGKCPEVWRRVKEWRDDPTKRKQLLRALQASL